MNINLLNLYGSNQEDQSERNQAFNRINTVIIRTSMAFIGLVWAFILLSYGAYSIWTLSPLFSMILVLMGIVGYFVYKKYFCKEEQRADIAGMIRELEQLSRERLLDKNSSEKRPRDWSIRRDLVIERDGHKCTRCGATSNLQVHHIVPVNVRFDHSGSNLITLCVKCHAEVDGRGHSSGLIKAQITNRGARLGYDRRRGRKIYSCARCRRQIQTGEMSFTKRAERKGGYWEQVKERICEDCMLD